MENPNQRRGRYSPAEIIPATGVTDIVSLPSSVRQKLEQVGSFVDRGMMPEANAALVQAGSELARTQPELLVLLFALQQGVRGIEVEETVRDTTNVTSPRRFLGFRLEDDVTVTSTTKSTRRRVRLV